MQAPSSSESPDARRRAALDRVIASGVDLVIVGGGITGAGSARDAAMRGLRVLLVEKADWASGTSSKSSKLVHGGLRYLETYQFGLVMEGTRERYVQQRMNPTLVTPLPFVMPVYRGGRHGIFKINLGLWLYDLLSLFRTPKMHRRLSPAKTHARVPPLRQADLAGSLHYYDCRTDDARLVLANVLDAERRGATTLARARYDGPVFGDDGKVRAARIHDAVLGRDVEVPCALVVHATGPWTDRVGAAIGEAARLRPTKGVHLVVAKERLPLDVAVALASIDDGRVVFAIPFGNTTYVGTTDTDYDGDPDHVAATAEDIAYLLRTANHFFPDQALTTADVRSTWAGLRPLIRSDAATAYKTSREHEIDKDPRGILTIAGGKLTTYRMMAEELVDDAITWLAHRAKARGEPAPKTARCRTQKVPMDAGDPGDARAARHASHPDEARPIVPDLDYTFADVAAATLGEQAWHLEDVLVRRLQVQYRAADCGIGAADAVARFMADLLGRDDAWVEREVASYQAYVDDQLRCVRGDATSAAPGPLARSA